MSQSPLPPQQPRPPQAAQPEEPAKEKRYLLTFGRTLAYLAYAYVVIVEIVLGLGFILELFGASKDAGFVRWIYGSMDTAMQPFRGIFPSVDIGSASDGRPQAVLNTSVLFAMLVYAIVAWAIHLVIFWFTTRLRRLEQDQRDAINRQTYLAANGALPDNRPNQQFGPGPQSGPSATGPYPPYQHPSPPQ